MASCAVVPKLPPDVAAAVARDRMRVLRTEHIDLYYPESEPREHADSFAARLEGCLMELRARSTARGGLSAQRLQVIHPNVPFNNAFVSPPMNGDFFSVVPTHNTLDLTLELGLPTAPDYIACHELAHYVHFQQTFRVWGGIDRALGKTLSPQIGLEAWFAEGLATYYEHALQQGTGRPSWPAWTGAFHAGIARDRISGGDLSDLNRQFHWGNHYLVGSHFIAFLVERYGEDKLWELITMQGKSFFFPFVVPMRFKHVYGSTLSGLIDEFAADAARRYPAREKPSTQRTVREVGNNGRYARAPDGSEAIVSESNDAPPTLSIHGPDGRLVQHIRLNDVLPPRRLAVTDARLVSGLSFTSDARSLYFTAIDRGAVYQEARLLRIDVRTGKVRRVIDDLSGVGGAVSPDGGTYYFVRNDARGQSLRALDLTTHAERTLYAVPARSKLSAPVVSADGTRIAASLFEGGYGVAIFDARTGARLQTLSRGGSALTDPAFTDDGRLLFVAAEQGVFQVFVHDLERGTTRQLTHAPYLALHARASGATVRFFSREGWVYTLDEVPLPPKQADGASTGDASGFSLASTIATLPPPPERAQPSATEEPYRAFPAVLMPTIRAPAFGLASGSATSGAQLQRGVTIGGQLLGSDPLGYHRWGLSAAIQIPSLRPSASLGYLNAQLAPLFIAVSASQLAYESRERVTITTPAPDGGVTSGRAYQTVVTQQRAAQLTLGLSLRTTQLSAGFDILDDYQSDNEPEAPNRRRLGGPSAGFSHASYEATPMSGPRRGFVLRGASTVYPSSLGTLPFLLTDLSGGLDLYTPLPLSRRHTLALRTRGRVLIHDQPRTQLLRVGGVSVIGAELVGRPALDDPGWFSAIPPQRRFAEPLRGYETLAIAANGLASAELCYRYPLILDAGVASTFGFLPSFFVRQLDLELFGVAATTNLSRAVDRGRLVAGGALTLRTRFYLVPLALQYQLSQRFTDDEALQHLLSLGVDLE